MIEVIIKGIILGIVVYFFTVKILHPNDGSRNKFSMWGGGVAALIVIGVPHFSIPSTLVGHFIARSFHKRNLITDIR